MKLLGLNEISNKKELICAMTGFSALLSDFVQKNLEAMHEGLDLSKDEALSISFTATLMCAHTVACDLLDGDLFAARKKIDELLDDFDEAELLTSRNQ